MTKERLEILLVNALEWIEEECGDFFVSECDNAYRWFENVVGITEDEFEELGMRLSDYNNEEE